MLNEVKVNCKKYFMSNEIIIASTTFSSEEKAFEMCSRKMIEKDLAACAQVDGPIISIYQWEGKVCEDVEWKVELKTSHLLKLKNCKNQFC